MIKFSVFETGRMKSLIQRREADARDRNVVGAFLMAMPLMERGKDVLGYCERFLSNCAGVLADFGKAANLPAVFWQMALSCIPPRKAVVVPQRLGKWLQR